VYLLDLLQDWGVASAVELLSQLALIAIAEGPTARESLCKAQIEYLIWMYACSGEHDQAAISACTIGEAIGFESSSL